MYICIYMICRYGYYVHVYTIYIYMILDAYGYYIIYISVLYVYMHVCLRVCVPQNLGTIRWWLVVFKSVDSSSVSSKLSLLLWSKRWVSKTPWPLVEPLNQLGYHPWWPCENSHVLLGWMTTTFQPKPCMVSTLQLPVHTTHVCPKFEQLGWSLMTQASSGWIREFKPHYPQTSDHNWFSSYVWYSLVDLWFMICILW